MIVTIDTNVLFQAFYSRRGASHQIVRLIRDGMIVVAISVPVFQEYRDGSTRDKNRTQLRLDNEQIDTIMQFLATVGKPTKISYTWRPNLRDEGDNMFIELARASGSECLDHHPVMLGVVVMTSTVLVILVLLLITHPLTPLVRGMF